MDAIRQRRRRFALSVKERLYALVVVVTKNTSARIARVMESANIKYTKTHVYIANNLIVNMQSQKSRAMYVVETVFASTKELSIRVKPARDQQSVSIQKSNPSARNAKARHTATFTRNKSNGAVVEALHTV